MVYSRTTIVSSYIILLCKLLSVPVEINLKYCKNLVTAVINTPLTDLICGEKYNATRKIMSNNGIRCMYLMETA